MPGTCGEIIERHRIRTSFLNRLPKRAYRHYLPLFPLAIESLDLDGYDLVVSTSHAVAKGCRPAKGAVHVAYIHTPMRYVWDQFEWYFGAGRAGPLTRRSEEHTSELQSRLHLVCRLLLEKKKTMTNGRTNQRIRHT